jgi:hypothetical protein
MKLVGAFRLKWSSPLKIPDSFQVLIPFAYSYLEDIVRSMTSTEYGVENKDGKFRVKCSKTIFDVIDQAIKENEKNENLVLALENIRKRFSHLKSINLFDNGGNRNSVAHGFLPPYYYSEDEFERLIKDIASISNSCI